MIRYEPAIDGLRAIAVAAVIVFHLDPRWLPGGFTGVDLFFVISGFLITRIVLGEFDAGTFNLWRFYFRRAARIVPALVFVGLATLIAARFIYDSKHIGAAAVALMASVLSVMNIKLCFQGNYFEASPLTQPFLHCWSLSLEEQFYVLFPLVLRAGWRRSRGAVAGGLAGLFCASLIACIVMTPRMPTPAFYLLPFRAWELLAGALLGAWVWCGQPGSRPGAASALRWAGTAGIVGSIAAIRESWGFPGWVALLPVVSTVAVIAAMLVDPERGTWKLLRWAPLVLLGKLSYSLYLVHWPVCSLVDCGWYMVNPWSRLAIKLVLTGVGACVVQAVVEAPARLRLLSPGTVRREAFALLFSVVILFVVGVNLRVKHRVLGARMDDVAHGGVVLNGSAGGAAIVLVGDSQANQYVGVLLGICRRLDRPLVVLSVSATQPIPGPGKPEPELWRRSLEVLREVRPAAIVVSCNWSRWVDGDRRVVDEVVGTLRSLAPDVVIATNTPFLPPTATREAICAGSAPPFFEDEDVFRKRSLVDGWLLAARSDSVHVIDVSGKVVNEAGQNRLRGPQGRYLYEDRYHFNEFGAALYEPDFDAALRHALRQ